MVNAIQYISSPFWNEKNQKEIITEKMDPSSHLREHRQSTDQDLLAPPTERKRLLEQDEEEESQTAASLTTKEASQNSSSKM